MNGKYCSWCLSIPGEYVPVRMKHCLLSFRTVKVYYLSSGSIAGMPGYLWRDSEGKGRGNLPPPYLLFPESVRCPVSFPANGVSRKVPVRPDTFLQRVSV